MKIRRLRRRGFSLVELIIAIAIIGIMSAAAVPLVQSTLNRAKNSRAQSEMGNIEQGFMAFYADTSTKPGTATAGCTSSLTWMSTDFNNETGNLANATDTGVWALDSLFYTGTDACTQAHESPNRNEFWRGPYIPQTNMLDPWGHAYAVAITDGVTNDYTTEEPGVLLSGGADETFNFTQGNTSLIRDDIGQLIILASTSTS